MAHLRLHHVVVALPLVLFPGGKAAITPAPSAQPPPPAAPSTATRRAAGDTVVVAQKDIDAGRKIFHGKGTCASCHGESLEGSAIAPTLRDHPWTSAKGGTLDAIYDVILHGVPGTAMVSHPGGVSDADARRVASYIWAVSHGRTKP